MRMRYTVCRMKAGINKSQVSFAILLSLGILLFSLPIHAQVVINEIFYHAPDDIADLQWVELYNTSDQKVNLGGWNVAKGLKYKFPANTAIEPHGYIVICKNRERFQEFYTTTKVVGEFDKSLKKSGEQLELRNGSGTIIDTATFGDRSPWPMSPDGETASLERICPTGSGTLPENWAASPLSDVSNKPGGTPGSINASMATFLPLVIRNISFPTNAQPNQPITVEADVQDKAGLSEVALLYSVVKSGSEGEEKSISMTPSDNQRYSASIPGQAAGQIVRFRIRASNQQSVKCVLPDANELHPAFSCLVWTNKVTGKSPWGYIINTDKTQSARQPGGRFNEEEMGRVMAQMQLRTTIDLPDLWSTLTLTNGSNNKLEALCSIFRRKMTEYEQFENQLLATNNFQDLLQSIPGLSKSFKVGVEAPLKSLLTPEQTKAFTNWRDRAPNTGEPFGRDPAMALRQFLRFEPSYLFLTTRTNLADVQLLQLRQQFRKAMEQRDALIPEVRAMMESRDNRGNELLTKVRNIQSELEQNLKSLLKPDQMRDLDEWRVKDQPSMMRGGGQREAPTPVRGKSAFIYVDSQTRQPKLFDFVHIVGRSGGWKIHFTKDNPLDGMTAINLIFEATDRWLLAESMAHEMHRRAGLAASFTKYVRLWADGRPIGYHLLIEQPNKSYFQRRGMRTDGNLYKATYMGDGVVGQHEKKINARTGHGDLVQLVDQLEKNRNDTAKQWEIIKREFDVEQVISHYAVRTLISDWDGFFNNYYLYHDIKGTKKWTFYPWDQDKTWGEYDGWEEGGLLYNMPLSFGAEGDQPPGSEHSQGPMGGAWWRPGGHISRPLLANTIFRKHFLARLKELLTSQFTEERLYPLLDQHRDRLQEEMAFRAQVMRENSASTEKHLEANLTSLKTFIAKRREWLLKQKDIENAGEFDRTQLK